MGTSAAVVGLVVLAVAVAVDLRFSPGYMRGVRTAVAAGDRGARTRMYRLTVALSWAAAATAVVVLLAGGVDLAGIGLRLPDAEAARTFGPSLVGAVAALAVGAAVMFRASRRQPSVRLLGDIDVLLPRSASERRWYGVVAVTAGVTEEVFYRAFALTVLTTLLPGGRWAALGAAAVVFGAAHAYQGWAGVLTTGVLALVLGYLYLGTGSLLPGMALHVLIDLRALLLSPAPDPARGGESAAPG